eukprot:12907151-Prorocentrum_lima.AAC.1
MLKIANCSVKRKRVQKRASSSIPCGRAGRQARSLSTCNYSLIQEGFLEFVQMSCFRSIFNKMGQQDLDSTWSRKYDGYPIISGRRAKLFRKGHKWR